MNRLGTIIYYVKDVEATVEFFEKAFGLDRAFIDPSGSYAQLDTGETALGFASLELARQNLPQGFRPVSRTELPGCEISFTAVDVTRSVEKALKAGAELVAATEEKPWGQTVAYLKDGNGILIEIGSEMAPHCDAHSCCCH